MDDAAAAQANSTWWLAPTPLVLVCSILIAALIPLLLHFVLYRSSANSSLPTFLLVGPSGAGKTALSTLMERGRAATTCTSQAPKTVEASVPVEFEVASNRYRSVNDPSARVHKRFLLTDTPGHGKLRHHALDAIRRRGGGGGSGGRSGSGSKVGSGSAGVQNLRGVMFVVDATALATDTPDLTDVAGYLHDVLLDLQTSHSPAKKDFPVLIVVNKLDLFTALPPHLARAALEHEITKIRESRARGILDASVSVDAALDAAGGAADKEWLGAGGEGPFAFAQMHDAGVAVTLEGSRAHGDGQADDIQALWTWMGNQL